MKREVRMCHYKSIVIAIFLLLKSYPTLGLSLMEKVIFTPKANLATSLAQENKVYVIQYEYDLKGKTVHVGYNSILLFEGGSLKNGVIEGNDTYIDAAPVKIFNKDISFKGTFKNQALYSEWFGVVGNDKTKAKENTEAFNAAINAAMGVNSGALEDVLGGVNCILLLNTRYYINGSINVPAAYFKITANSITPIGYVNHKMPIIEQLANVPVITFKDRLIDDTYYGQQLTHVVLENFKIYGAGVKKTLYGIGKENCTSFNSCEFKNLLVLGCRYGLFFDLATKAGVYNNFFENVTTRECILGLYLKTAISNSNWMNVNTFSRCWFVNNRNCGVVIERMMNQSGANLFETCTFECNGEGYDIDDYQLYGASGVTLLQSQAEFHNCYFEANFASRFSKGDVKKGESFFTEGGVGENMNCGSHIEPKSISNKEGNLVLGQGQIRLSGCIINSGHRLITCGPLSPQLDIQGCNISNNRLNSKTSDAIVDYLLDNNGNRDPIYLKINNLGKKTKALTNQLKYAYRIDGKLNAKFSKKFSMSSDIDIDVSAIESIVDPREYNQLGFLDEMTILYVDNINGNDRNTGTNPANALKTLSGIKDIISIEKNRRIRVVFSKDYVVTENVEFRVNDNARIDFSSLDPNNPVSITLKVAMLGLQMGNGIGDMVFRNINFKCDAPLTESPKAECKWYFDNCSITINKGTFIKCTEGKQDVYFKNCVFNSDIHTSLSDISITKSSGKGELNTQVVDCLNKKNLLYNQKIIR